MTWQGTIRSLILAAVLVSLTQAQLYREPQRTADQNKPKILDSVGIDQRLDSQVPLDLNFRDEYGRPVKLGEYFNQGKPVILTMVYYTCPMLCSEVLTGLTSTMQVLKFDAGREFQVLSVSINPHETPQDAQRKKKAYTSWYRRPTAENGWHYLTGDEPQIEALAQAVGFRYAIDPKSDPKNPQYAHANAIMVLTPEGKLAQYYYGIEFSPKDLRLALVEASKNRIGTLADAVLLYCYHYDPSTGRYGAVVMNLVRLGGILTVLTLGAFMTVMFRRDARNRDPQAGRRA